MFNLIGNIISTIVYNFTSFIYTLVFQPWAILSAPTRWMLGLSIPGRVAALIVVFLCVCVITVGVMYWVNPTLVPWWESLTYQYVAVIGVLMLLIPIVFYYAMWAWFEGKPSQFPDIDFAWRAGIQELERKGLKLDNAPLFLVLGTPEEHFESAFVRASRLTLQVDSVPQGQAALHWYANLDAIYIVCSRVGCLSAVSAAGESLLLDGESQVVEPPVPSGRNIQQTYVPEDTGSRQESRSGGGGGYASHTGTMMPGTLEVNIGTSQDLGGHSEKPKTIRVAPEELNEQRRRLTYLCDLISRGRQPFIPLNGILTLLPFHVIHSGPMGGSLVQSAAKTDLAAIAKSLPVRCPATALIVGMESDKGFRELMRRLGSKRTIAQRFGKGYHLWSTPTAEQMVALCTHACGAFELWVYNLFREPEAMLNPRNRRLYLLLCKIRRQLQDRLANVLMGGFGQGADTEHAPFLFGGCYFAAVGEREEHQAFVKAVVEKLLEQQEEVEWTPEAIRQEARYQTLARFGMVIDVLLAIGFIALLVMYFLAQYQ